MLLLTTAAPLHAATNDLTSLLQQALFEEEANRNLDAAIPVYQSLVNQFDKDRQVAATAIFRLGECYRKLGRTNDAVVQYQRILSEFADQDTLATLSRQDLAGLGAAPAAATPGAGGPAGVALTESGRAQQRDLIEQEIKLAEQSLDSMRKKVSMGVVSSDELLPLQRDVVELKRQLVAVMEAVAPATESGSENTSPEYAELRRTEEILAHLRGWDLDRLRDIVPATLPDKKFDALNNRLTRAEMGLSAARSGNPAYSGSVTDAVQEQEARVEDVRRALRGRLDELLAELTNRVAVLKAELTNRTPEMISTASGPVSVVTDEENQEIRRIQEMINNSPDLINGSISAGGDANSEGSLTPLGQAAEAGQVRVAAFLLDHGADTEKPSRTGPGSLTPLMLAARAGHNTMVQLLLGRGANVNAANPNGFTALHFAVERGFSTVTETLLASNANANAGCMKYSFATTLGGHQTTSITPLQLAANNGNLALVEMLLAHDAKADAANSDGGTALSLAAAGHAPEVRTLLAAGAKPALADVDGNTPLHVAARENANEAARDLLAHGAPVDAQNRSGATPLTFAVLRNHPEMVETLLQSNANPNLPSSDSQHLPFQYLDSSIAFLPIAYAVRFSDQILALLLDHGAEPEARADSREPRPLLQAVELGNAKAVELLLQHKANPNTIPGDQESPLFLAVNRGYAGIIRDLLDHGADPNMPQNRNGHGPLLGLSSQAGQAEIVGLLLNHGVNVNEQGVNGYTALHLAVERNHPEVVKLLLDHGADPNIQNNWGQTALDIAKGETGSGATGAPLAYQWTGQPPGTRPMRSPPAPPVGAGNATPPAESSSVDVAALLLQHGALADLPKADAIEVRRPGGASDVVFRENTNHWNQFTLLETIFQFYRTEHQGHNPGGASFTMAPQNFMPFPALNRIVIVRRVPGAATETRIPVDLTNGSNGIDCSKDLALEFGDAVEIPERLHPIGQADIGLTPEQTGEILNCLKGSAQLVTSGRQVVLPLMPGPGNFRIGSVLSEGEAQNALLSSADLSRVKVSRRNAMTGQTQVWTLDCSQIRRTPFTPDFYIRNGDVIEVPDKS